MNRQPRLSLSIGPLLVPLALCIGGCRSADVSGCRNGVRNGAFEIRDELVVSCVAPSELPKAGDGSVIACYFGADASGTTSIRFETDSSVRENKYPVSTVTVFGDRGKYPQNYVQRDRDLGQTFLAGDAARRLDAVYLKVGPNGGDPSALGARVAIQIFEVSGSPVLNQNGTPGFSGGFNRASSPELDDYLEGEAFQSLAVAQGTLPSEIGANAILKWDLTGRSEIVLEPNRCYAFLVMLVDPKPKQQLSLANHYHGSYAPDSGNRFVGHGIRREGFPKFMSLDDRLRQSPGTLGFPDVCTWRDFFFCVTGKPLE